MVLHMLGVGLGGLRDHIQGFIQDFSVGGEEASGVSLLYVWGHAGDTHTLACVQARGVRHTLNTGCTCINQCNFQVFWGGGNSRAPPSPLPAVIKP